MRNRAVNPGDQRADERKRSQGNQQAVLPAKFSRQKTDCGLSRQDRQEGYLESLSAIDAPGTVLSGLHMNIAHCGGAGLPRVAAAPEDPGAEIDRKRGCDGGGSHKDQTSANDPRE